MRIKTVAAICVLVGSLIMIPGAPAHAVGFSPDPDGISQRDSGTWIPPVGSVWRAVSKVIGITQSELALVQNEVEVAKGTPLAYAACRASLGDCIGIAGERICPIPYGTYFRVATIIVPFDTSQFHAYGVWDIFEEDGCYYDPSNYYIWKFQVSGNSKTHYTLDRLKGRSEADNYQASGWWPPNNDQSVGNPTTISGSIQLSKDGAGGSFGLSYQLFPGRRHGYVAEHLYHNSWISNSSAGAGCCPSPSIETDGANEWKTTSAENGLQGVARIEVWFHDCNDTPAFHPKC